MLIAYNPSPLGPHTATGSHPATSTADPVTERVRKDRKAKMAKSASFQRRPWFKNTPLETRPQLRVRNAFIFLSSYFYWRIIPNKITCEGQRSLNKYFLEPRASAANNDPAYREVVKTPMDLTTMQSKWNDLTYFGSPPEIFADFKLVINNARSYYPRGHKIRVAAIKLLRIFMDGCARVRWSRWMGKMAEFVYKRGLLRPGVLERFRPRE